MASLDVKNARNRGNKRENWKGESKESVEEEEREFPNGPARPELLLDGRPFSKSKPLHNSPPTLLSLYQCLCRLDYLTEWIADSAKKREPKKKKYPAPSSK